MLSSLLQQSLLSFLCDVGEDRTNLGTNILDGDAVWNWRMIVANGEIDFLLPVVASRVFFRDLEEFVLDRWLESPKLGIKQVTPPGRSCAGKHLFYAAILTVALNEVLECRQCGRRSF